MPGIARALMPQQCSGCGRLRSGPCPICRDMLLHEPPGDAPAGVTALCCYGGLARDLITGMKYRRQHHVAEWFAESAAHRRHEFPGVDVITWAPTSSSRRRHRGFDQAELVARHLARRWDVPARRLLARQGGGHQTGRSRAERLGGPAFRGRPLTGRPGVLVVDDVVTTGATLWAAVAALRQAGACEVHALALAATPPPEVLHRDGRPVPAGLGR